MSGSFWDMIGSELNYRGWCWGASEAVGSEYGSIVILEAYNQEGARLVVHSDDKRSAVREMKRLLQSHRESSLQRLH